MVKRDIVVVTGGMGFIGQHVVSELLKCRENVHIIDNLSRSQSSDVDIFSKIQFATGNEGFKINCSLFKYDITDVHRMDKWFSKYGSRVKLIIHLAAVKSVSESILNPDLYFQTNTQATEYLIEKTLEYQVPFFVFSSTACVYGGNCPVSGYTEEDALHVDQISNPYGQSKRLSEIYMELLTPKNNSTVFVSLRYFNPVGCHSTGLIGEDYTNTKLSNLFPIVWTVINGKRDKLHIYGNDYPNSKDGTPERDFIAISDLVSAHVSLLDERNSQGLRPGYYCFNVGTGKSTSVLELVRLFEDVLEIKIPHQLSKRRPGDQELSFACTKKIYNTLGWKCTANLMSAIVAAKKRNTLLMQ
jgi:UDP-glucose 4-epimerase